MELHGSSCAYLSSITLTQFLIADIADDSFDNRLESSLVFPL